VIPDAGRESGAKMSRTAMLIRVDLTYRVRKDLAQLEIPELWTEIGEARRRKTLIGVVYREFRRWKENPQNNSTGEDRHKKQFGDTKERILMGNWNADMLRIKVKGYDRRKIGSLIMTRMVRAGMAQLVTETTHHGDNSSRDTWGQSYRLNFQ
jgi:hypothetical protein